MSAEDIKALESWHRELEREQFQNDGRGSCARRTDSAMDADYRCRLLARVLRRLVVAGAERSELERLRAAVAEAPAPQCECGPHQTCLLCRNKEIPVE